MLSRISNSLFILSLFALSFIPVLADDYGSNTNYLDEFFDEKVFSSISPQAPTAASLGQFGSHPVDLSTGLVPITIPLYEIHCGSLIVPVQLSYHGGGIKVEQDASWVGLGWTLDFGGAITRTKNGLIDEEEDYSDMPEASDVISDLNANNTSVMRNCHLWAEGNLSGYSFHPDLFAYSFGSHCGTFCLSADKDSIITHDYDPISGSLSALSGYSHRLAGVESFVSADGTRYFFNASEQTRITGPTSTISQYTSAYYIQAIISADKADTIRYEYQPSGNYSQNFPSQYGGIWTSNGILDGPDMEGYNATTQPQLITVKQTGLGHYTSTVKPQYIFFRGGRLVFYLSDGLFVSGNTQCKKLSSIGVEMLHNGQYRMVKNIIFSYTRDGRSRLLLSSVREIGVNGSPSRLLAAFDYYSCTLQSGQDYWGYHNGKSNTDMVPRTWIGGILVGNADRTPDEESMKSSSLKRIIYPTTGSVEFIWETNRVVGENSYYPVVPYRASKTISVAPDFSHTCEPPAVGQPSLGSDDYYVSDNITISSIYPQNATLTYSLSANDINGLNHKKYDDIHISVNGQEIISLPRQTQSLSGSISYQLEENRTYSFVITANCNNLSGSLTIDYVDTDSPDSNAGTVTEGWKFTGLRIKEMILRDSDGSIIRRNLYGYVNPSGTCSGYLTSLSQQISNLRHNYEAQMVGNYIYLKHNTMICSDMTEGPREDQFAYEYATETVIDGKTDKALSFKRYHFNRTTDIQNNIHSPVISMSHLRRRVLKTEEFRNTNDTVELVRLTENTYTTDSRIHAKQIGFVVYTPYTGNAFISGEGCRQFLIASGGGTGARIYSPANYEYPSLWSHLDSQSVVEYYDGGSVLQTHNSFIYGNPQHALPTELKTARGNVEQITRNQYSGDVANDAICSEMVQHKIYGLPVYQRFYRKELGAEVLQTGIKHVYNNQFLKTEVYEICNSISNQEALVRLYSYKYNEFRKLSQFIGRDSIPVSVWWDGYYVRPVVIASGMTDSALSAAISNIQLTDMNVRNLCKNNLFRGASLQTYTYHEDGSISSITSPNGVTDYYQYDGLGRLTSVFDLNGRLVQKMFYHYAE